MSVLGCDRTGCQNIMCERYSSDHGYLCHKCFEELVALGQDANIEEFMGTVSTGGINNLLSSQKWNNVFII